MWVQVALESAVEHVEVILVSVHNMFLRGLDNFLPLLCPNLPKVTVEHIVFPCDVKS